MVAGLLMFSGLACVAYGLAISSLRAVAPERLARLAPLRARFGRSRGTLIHGLMFTSTPIALGMWLTFEGAMRL